MRVAETKYCDDSWPKLRRELERLQVGTFEGQVGFLPEENGPHRGSEDHLPEAANLRPPELQEIRPAAKASQARSRPQHP